MIEDYDLNEDVEKFIAEVKAGTRRQSLSNTILKDMGCPYFIRTRSGVNLRQEKTVMDVGKVNENLYRLMVEVDPQKYSHNDLAAMMSGLGRYGGWQKLIETEDDTYRLLYALVSQSEGPIATELDIAVSRDVNHILNDWAGKIAAQQTLPTTSEVCRALLGDAWCEIVLPTLKGVNIAQYLYLTRPPFAPGVRSTLDQSESIQDLPALD